MAITWEVQITVLDYDQKHVSVSGTRTDSTDPDNPRTYTATPRHIDTADQKIAVMDEMWALRTSDVALDDKKAAFAPIIETLETQAKANLEAREV